MPWRKGQSGNSKGRPKGCGGIAVVRATLAQSLPEVIEALIAKAKEGDVPAMKLLLDRTIPALRPEELPVQVPGLTGVSRTEVMRVVIDAIADGRLDMNRGGRFLALLKPSELDERAECVERMLEDRENDDKH